jgi:diguanylate cyclase (GGDEF)-like protein/PAS domain S-box-containing protein
MSWTLTTLFVLLLVAWLFALILRHRDRLAVRQAAEHLVDLAETGEALPSSLSEGITQPLVEQLTPLVDQLMAAQQLVRDQDQQLMRLLTHLHEPAAIHGQSIQYINQAFVDLLGVQSASEVLGKNLANFIPEDQADLLSSHLRRATNGDTAPTRIELELTGTESRAARIELEWQRLQFQGKSRLLLTVNEISPQLIVQSPVAKQLQSINCEALDALSEGILTTDDAGRIEHMNRAAEQLMGLSLSEARGREFTQLVSLVDESDRHPLANPIKQSLTTQTRISAGRRSLLVTQTAQEYPVDISVSPLKSSLGNQIGTVVMMRDVSELRGLTRQMSYQASHDALTGLVNRREFERRLQEVVDSAHSTSARHVLCYLDLDRFKLVNDTVGHLAGDGLLREVAGLMKEAVRDTDVVARLGGDEFGLILTSCPLEKATQIAEDVMRKINDYRYVFKDKVFTIGISIGLVELATDSGNLEEVMSAADSACYVAKRQNGYFGNHVHVYSARDEAVARQRGEIQWLKRLQTAIKENKFELLAQPIVAVTPLLFDGGPAMEVLLRLRDDQSPEGIPPSEFVRAAERYRLMVDIDRWVVQTALTALGRGGIRLPESASLAINLSGQTLADPSFLEFVVECLDTTGVAPQRLCFEVTENAVMTNVEQTQRFIGVLHGLGATFALDNFGRGLSSFGNLKTLGIDYLKIDGSFIRNLHDDAVNQAMVSSMVKLARSLNFKVIAGQVEDSSALNAARRIGVDFLQGYELARPQPLARVVMRAAS